MYTMDARVRYSEVDSDNKMKPTALLDYLQDCCLFQAEDLGIGVEYLAGEHLVWLLSAWQVVILRRPSYGERVRVATWAYDFKGFYGYRNFDVTTDGGERVAMANSIWICMDTEKMCPIKVLQSLMDAYAPSMEPMIEYPWAGRKLISRIGGGETGNPVAVGNSASAENQTLVGNVVSVKEPVAVTRFHIDTNHHVNNAAYVRLAEEYLPEGFSVGEIRAEYKKAAVLGDVMRPTVATDADGVTVQFADAAGEVYASVRFLHG